MMRTKKIQDQLLNGGPPCKILSQDGNVVNSESWPRMIEAYKTQTICLTFVIEENQSDDQDHTSTLQPKSSLRLESSDIEDDEHLDLVGSGVAADQNSQQVPAIDQLRQLQNRLHRAILKAEGVKKYELMQMHMPVLETLIHELTPKNHKPRPPGVPGLEDVTFLGDPGTAIDNTKDNVVGPRVRIKGRYDSLVQDMYPSRNPEVYETQQTLSPREESLPRMQHQSHQETKSARHPPRPDNVDCYEDHLDIRYPHSAPPTTKPLRGHASFHSSIPGNAPRSVPVASSLPLGYAISCPPADRYAHHWARTAENYPPGDADVNLSIPGCAAYHPTDRGSSAGQGVQFGGSASRRSTMQPVLNDQARNFLPDPEKLRGKSSSIYYRPLNGRFDTSERELLASSRHKIETQPSGACDLPIRSEAEIETEAEQLQEKPRVKKLLKLARKEVHRALKNTKPTPTVHVTLPVEDSQRGHLPFFLWSIENTVSKTIKQNPSELTALINEKSGAAGLDGDGLQSRPPHIEELILHTILSEAHAKLGKATSDSYVEPEMAIRVGREIAVMYEVIEHKTALQIIHLLNSMSTKKQNVSKADIKGGQSHTCLEEANSLAEKRITYEIAEKCLNAFVPKECDGPVVAKYWGSVYRLFTEKDDLALHNFSLRLKELWLMIRNIQMGVEANEESKHVGFHIPSALPAAFQQLVMFMVISSSASNEVVIRMKVEDCKALLAKSRTQLIQMIHTPDFRGRIGFETVDPEALLALMISNVISKMSTEDESDLTEIYREYTLKLQRMVRDRASVKVFDEIKLLQEEMEVIKTTLAQQDSVLQDFKSIVCEDHHSTSLGIALTDRILERIERRIEDFDKLQEQANTARFLAAQSISLKAEDNNKAIIVFTVTTITFLPLSFVTSYLGMNTSDLRNMSSGQTLFWTVGAPLAFVLLSVALIAAYFASLRQRALRVIERLKKKYD